MEEKKKILIVEDDPRISTITEYNLKRAGYDTEIASDGGLGLTRALSGEFDLILLDIMLPVMDGYEVCAHIRRHSQVPIIFVTARESEKDKILGLDTGADDYVTKPFSIPELLSRIRANIRRTPREFTQKKTVVGTVTIGDLTIDSERYLVTIGGNPVELSEKEYDILALLAASLGQPVGRSELLAKVWGYDGEYQGDHRTVDVAISRLREKIEADTSKPEYLITKRGVGYYLRDPSVGQL